MRKNKIHWKNPPNPHMTAWLDTWRAYTTAYHDDAPADILADLYSKYDDARALYAKNPQQIFNPQDLNCQ